MAAIINFPRVRDPDRRNINLAVFPNLRRRHDAMVARPAVQHGRRPEDHIRQAVVRDSPIRGHSMLVDEAPVPHRKADLGRMIDSIEHIDPDQQPDEATAA